MLVVTFGDSNASQAYEPWRVSGPPAYNDVQATEAFRTQPRYDTTGKLVPPAAPFDPSTRFESQSRPIRYRSEWISSEMGIDFSRPGLRVTEQLLRRTQATTALDDHRRERVTQIVTPKTWQSGICANRVPGLLDRAQMCPLLLAWQDVGIPSKVWERPDDIDHQPTDDDGPATCLAVSEP